MVHGTSGYVAAGANLIAEGRVFETSVKVENVLGMLGRFFRYVWKRIIQ